MSYMERDSRALQVLDILAGQFDIRLTELSYIEYEMCVTAIYQELELRPNVTPYQLAVDFTAMWRP